MRLFCGPIAAMSFALALALPALATPVNLPAGTRVPVRLVNSISSGNATVGQRFAFQAAAPVVVDNRVLIAKGASGMGHVVRVQKAQGKSAGEITLEFTSVHAVDGKLVALTEATSKKGNPEKGKASTATIAATIALGPLGLFAHNMVKGKDVTINSGQVFDAWVKANSSVNVP
jgi:hypothetical protein